VEQQLQKLMKQLGDAINETLSDSEQIAEVISRIKAGGYDVFLVLEATIGFNKREEESEPAKRRPASPRKSEPEFKVSTQDLRFLKSLRISIDGKDGKGKDRAA
jgi:hypothetical protein